MSQPMLLDTDTLSILMRNPASLKKHALAYLATHKQFTFSIFTKYEILRGLKAKNATTKIKVFNEQCNKSILLPITDEIIEKAADIYADLRKKGKPIGDGDILIAATAIVNNHGVVTNNEKHFKQISGLRVENWLNP